MGIDLVSVCVFCASLMLGNGLVPPPGFSAELGGSYSTIQRKYDTPPDAPDFSNVTAKFVLIGVRQVWPAEGGLGAGTPAREWRVRLALGPSHNDQTQLPSDAPGRTTANGTGRYENFAVLYRHPLSAGDSLELGWNHDKNSSTDGVDLGASNYVLSEQRLLDSERDEVALGWRHRFLDLEAGVAGRYTLLRASNITALFSGSVSGHLWGADAEARWRTGRLTLQARGAWMTGDPKVSEESLPDFAKREFHATASFKSVTGAVIYAWPKTDLSASYTYNWNRLPFTTFAVLGAEVDALESGFHPDSRANLSTFGLTARTQIGAFIRVYVSTQLTWGSETVLLTDSSGVQPSRSLLVHWQETGSPGSNSGRGPGYTIAAGAEFSIGPLR